MDCLKCVWKPYTLKPNAVSERELSNFDNGGAGEIDKSEHLAVLTSMRSEAVEVRWQFEVAKT